MTNLCKGSEEPYEQLPELEATSTPPLSVQYKCCRPIANDVNTTIDGLRGLHKPLDLLVMYGCETSTDDLAQEIIPAERVQCKC